MQGEDAEEQTRPSMIVWGSGGPIAPREEPEEATENRRSSYLETEDRGRNQAYQSTEEDTGQRPMLVHTVGRSAEEPERLQPEISAGSRSLTEEGTGEMDISDREDSTETAESGPPQTGQGGARKRKSSKDREPTKLATRPSEPREEKAKNRPSPGHTEMGWVKKLEEKARSVLRTLHPPGRTQKVSHPLPGQKGHQHSSQSEPG